jgi:ribosomal protein S27AE
MGVLESTCPACGAGLVIVFHDRSLETLVVERTCGCPAVESPRVLTD